MVYKEHLESLQQQQQQHLYCMKFHIF